ncbi:MAG: single-stranded DNA-binding protein [Fimbriimonadaceae bacterium]|nr:single-stranded DNA-binding protein [Fimbriimonadaceae bacterium]
MLNRVILIGRLTRDPELRNTTTGKSVVEFSIAVDKRFKPKDGSAAADFFKVKAWGQTAEFVNNYLTKGRLVAVDGRLETRKYQAQDGTNREVVEVVADDVRGLDRPRDDQGGGSSPRTHESGGAGGSAVPDADEYDPFADE